jgi:hypothetical protein
MKKLRVAILVTITLALCSLSLIGKHQEPKPKKKYLIDYQLAVLTEGQLRHDALVTVMPEYPAEAVNAGTQGLAEVGVLFDENGDYKGMRVLESPHPIISKAVAEALKQWKVKIYEDSPYQETALPIRPFGEVRFHFVIRDGVATVEPATPEEQRVSSPLFARTKPPTNW